MINYSAIGFISWFGSCILLIFDTLSGLTGVGSQWQDIRLADLSHIASIVDPLLSGVGPEVRFILNLPLFTMLFLFGILAFLIDGLRSPK